VNPHDLRFFLHGNDIPGTAGGFTRNRTPAPAQTLSLNLLNAPSWFSDPTLTGTFRRASQLTLTMPCTLGVGLGITFTLAATDPAGVNPQLLGQRTQLLTLCAGRRTVEIPVPTPVTLTNQRPKLTISSVLSVNLNLQLGTSTFLEATDFVGTP
jgi:hypothetical protein